MNKKDLSHLPLALLIVALFVGSFIFLRFNSEAINNNIKSITSKVAVNTGNKNLGNSKFIPAVGTVDSLDNCNVDIKLNSSKLEQVPGAPASTNPNVKRFTYKSIDTKKTDNEEKVGSVDIACVGLENTIKQLTSTIDTANKQDPAKITELFGMPADQLAKLDAKSLYRLFIIKRATAGECSESEKTSEIKSVSSELESRMDKKYVDCEYKYKNNEGVVARIIKYKYLFDKDSKFVLQVGESDADTLGINEQFLLINKI